MVVPISTPLRYMRYPATAMLSVEPLHATLTCSVFDEVTARLAGAVGAFVSPDLGEIFGALGGEGVGAGDLATTFFAGEVGAGVGVGVGVGVTPGSIAFGATSNGGEMFVAFCEAVPFASITIWGGVYVFARYIPHPLKKIKRNVAM